MIANRKTHNHQCKNLQVGRLPLTLSPSNFWRSGSTPVRVLRNCLRSSTVSSSESVVTEYSCPPHFTMMGSAILQAYEVVASVGTKHLEDRHTHSKGLQPEPYCTV